MFWNSSKLTFRKIEMKTKLKLSEFFEYVGITYDDDMSEFIHYEYEIIQYLMSYIIYLKQFKLTEKQT